MKIACRSACRFSFSLAFFAFSEYFITFSMPRNFALAFGLPTIHLSNGLAYKLTCRPGLYNNKSSNLCLKASFITNRPFRKRLDSRFGSVHLAPISDPALSNILEESVADSEKLAHRLKVGSFFVLWYAFNIGYNLYTKWTLNVLPMPCTLAAAQLIAGIPYVFLLWFTGLRKAPIVSYVNMKDIFPVAMMHCFAHLAAVVSLGAGAVGFVQIVKAAEPLFTAALNALILGQILAWPVYLTLLPVVAGVAIASMQELRFSMIALIAAMCSNICAATRSVIGKRAMGQDIGKNMDAGNLYAVMTIMATLVLIPLAAVIEGSKIQNLYAVAIAAGSTPTQLTRNIALSGVFFYLYNEVAFYCLNAIHPLTHGIGNTIKRVVMIFVSVIAFNHKFTPLGIMGSATAISGVLLYSLVKGYYDSKSRKILTDIKVH